MIKVKNTTKAAKAIIAQFHSDYWNKGTIYDAYNKPSSRKIRAYEDIEDRARSTEGYNYDLKVVAAGCQTFSTMYSYTDAEGTHIVYDTATYTRVVDIA